MIAGFLRPLKRFVKNGLLLLPASGPSNSPRVYINTNPRLNQGPNVFVRKIGQGLKKRNIGVSYLGMRGCQAALLLNNTWGDYFYRLAKRYGTRVVVRVDGFYPSVYFDGRPAEPLHQDRRMTPEKKAFNDRLKADLTTADHVVYQSAWSKKMCDTYLVPRGRDFSIVYNGVDLNRFKPSDKSKDGMTLLAVGNLRHQYMMSTIGSIFLALRKTLPVNLLIAGTMDTINARIWAQFRRDHPTEFQAAAYAGPVRNEDLPEIYRRGDVYIHPRAGDCCPNVVVEALASGVPVVCPEWGGTAELIGEGGVAVEAEPWDYSEKFIASMTAGAKKVLADIRRYKEKARAQAVNQFDLEKMTESYRKVLLPEIYAKN
jgi:glycosyltransferase involved in cell wall biosynthesis